ncbi:MAG: hypothetical protein MUF61_00200 [archaeon]|jgi:tRNA nucleotidyltransferase (CCA-adding enzyme)|nr:hypothetical protein [archaeon]
MTIKSVLDSLDLFPDKSSISVLQERTKELCSLIRDGIKAAGIDAEVFPGGSFSKATLVKGEFYDVDIFVRFNWKHEGISELLNRILTKIAKKNKLNLEKLHGSRDYFRFLEGKNIIFEIVPVTKIKKPKEARNVTDLSYFHVNYAKRKLGKNLAKEVIFAKQFCKAQKVYGAESYVQGFSGYSLECLIINYKSFEKMLKALVKVKKGGRLIIDPGNAFKRKADVLFEMNESKLNSPIILVDPTWKERNALAALSRATFERFQEAAASFLKRPSRSFFEIEKLDIIKMRNRVKKGEEFASIELSTDKQPGDIAGTKMRKFSNYLSKELSRYFNIRESEFEYNGETRAVFALILESKGEIMRAGPPVKMEKDAKAFKKQNKNVFEKQGRLHAKIKVNFTAKKFIHEFSKKYKKTIEGMGINGLKVN